MCTNMEHTRCSRLQSASSDCCQCSQTSTSGSSDRDGVLCSCTQAMEGVVQSHSIKKNLLNDQVTCNCYLRRNCRGTELAFTCCREQWTVLVVKGIHLYVAVLREVQPVPIPEGMRLQIRAHSSDMLHSITVYLFCMYTYTHKYTHTLYIVMGPLQTVGGFQVTVREVVDELLASKSVT